MRRLLAIALLSCRGPTPAPAALMQNKAAQAGVDADFDTFERAWVAEGKQLAERLRSQGRTIADKDIPTSYRGIFVGRGGVLVDRTRISTLAEIDTNRGAIRTAVADNIKLAPSVGLSPGVVLDLDHEPASIAIAALRAVAGNELIVSMRMPDGGTTTRPLCSPVRLRAEPRMAPEGDEHVTLSVLMDREHIWVGLSRVNEFHDIPDRAAGRDLEKLETVLKEHKASAFFADRNDAELGADPGQPSSDLLAALDLLCKVGWTNLAVLPREKLSAVPQL